MRSFLVASIILLSFSLSTNLKADEREPAEEAKKGAAPAEAAKPDAKGEMKSEMKDAPAAGAEGGMVTCKNGGDVRTLTKTKPEGKACAVMYKKGDSENSVADATNDAGYCDKVIEKMKANLATSGFTCE